MKVLVTGAAGRVGANVVDRLVAAGSLVRAMVMPGDAQAAKLDSIAGVEVVEADLRDQESVTNACKDVTHVIHLAAQLIRGDTPVDVFYDINALGTLRLLEGVLRSGSPIERFVLASTDGTYRPGAPPAVPLVETSEQEPADYYGTAKLLGEVILRNHSAQFDIPFSMVRFATVVSPEEASGYFTVGFLRGLLGKARLGKDSNIWPLFEGQPDLLSQFEIAVGDLPDEAGAAVWGPDGPWTLHLLDVRDAVQGVLLALNEPKAASRVFNIAAEEPTSYDAAASLLAETQHVPIVSVEMPLTWQLELSINAAQRELGYQPRYDYASMLRTAAADEVARDDRFIPARI